MTRLIAIDPWDCWCTECHTGEYKPLANADDDDIADLIAGRLQDNTPEGLLVVTVTYRTEKTAISCILKLVVDTVTVTMRKDHGYLTYDKEWNPDPYRAGLKK